MRNNTIIEAELFLCGEFLGHEKVFWTRNYEEVSLHDFELPKNLNRETSDVLIPIPDGYGYGVGLQEFYIDPGLEIMHQGRWRALPHYYGSRFRNKYTKKGWHWLCIHPDWNEDDNLLTFLQQVYIFLQDPFE